jgi:hypothetical protein
MLNTFLTVVSDPQDLAVVVHRVPYPKAHGNGIEKKKEICEGSERREFY